MPPSPAVSFDFRQTDVQSHDPALQYLQLLVRIDRRLMSGAKQGVETKHKEVNEPHS